MGIRNISDTFRDSIALVLGAGISGLGAVRLLKSLEIKTYLMDQTKSDFASAEPDQFFYDNENLTAIGTLDFIIKSPGILPDHPFLKQAREKNIRILSEIEFARMLFKGKVIGITGTDGKSTTTALTHHLVLGEYPNSAMGGNIGHAFSDFCRENIGIAILELSSYQLDDSSPIDISISCILNLAPDHLERHLTLENYRDAKKKIINGNNPNHIFITNRRTEKVLELKKDHLKCKVLFFGEDKKNDAYIQIENQKIKTKTNEYNTRNFPLQGTHNLENLAASILISESAGVNPEIIQSRLESFEGLQHRFQKVATISGIQFINDSKSTNSHSLLSGLKGFSNKNKLFLILGGKPKKESLEPLKKRLSELNSIVFLYGDAATIWNTELQKTLKEKLIIKNNLEEVMIEVESLIKTKADVKTVLFSPACASFDQYKNFEERGNHFISLVKNLEQKVI